MVTVKQKRVDLAMLCLSQTATSSMELTFDSSLGEGVVDMKLVIAIIKLFWYKRMFREEHFRWLPTRIFKILTLNSNFPSQASKVNVCNLFNIQNFVQYILLVVLHFYRS